MYAIILVMVVTRYIAEIVAGNVIPTRTFIMGAAVITLAIYVVLHKTLVQDEIEVVT